MTCHIDVVCCRELLWEQLSIRMATGYELPQMKSIWLDEDQEAEKLYAQQFMGSDEEESVAIKVVNSNKPVLKNKKKIDLPPLSKHSMGKASDISSAVGLSKKSKKKKGFLAFWKGKDHAKPQQISTPFAFQHISHANTTDGFESESEDMQSSEPKSKAISAKQGPLHQAFVTQSIPTGGKDSSKIGNRKRASMISRRSLSGSISTASSSYSRSSAGRIVSSSTMATSIHHDSPSPSRLPLLNAMEKCYFKGKSARDSKDSDISLEFLKNYDFPTLLEAKSAIDLCKITKQDITPIIEIASFDDNVIQNDDFDLGSINSLPIINKTSSDSKLLKSPEIENEWFDDTTTTTRRSVDDILLCYHIPSDAGSFIQTPFSSPTKSLTNI